jgi:8-oxo-dGTP diphosphatase
METKPKLFVAAKAFIKNNDKILVLQESPKYDSATNVGKYDITGGRLEPGEDFFETLKREIKEETGLDVQIGKPFFVNEFRPTVNNEPWQIIAVIFECFSDNDEVTLSKDHSHYKWINPEEYKDHNIIENLHKVFDAYLKK